MPPGDPAVAAAEAPADRDVIGAGALRVQIVSFSPAVPAAGDTLVVAGTVTSTAEQPVSDVSVVLRVSPSPLPSRQEIGEVLAGRGLRTGEPVPQTRTALAESLGPGQSTPFRLEVAVDDLALPSLGVYVTGVEALGSSGAGVVRQDLDRTFLPWWPADTTAQPLLLTTLWPLVAPPVRDVLGVLLDEQPAVEMSPTGRLATLLEAAAREPGAVTMLLDPDAALTAGDLADGYQVVGSQGTTTAGTRSAEVARWLASLREALDAPETSAAAMLYGQPDVVAAHRGRALPALLRQRPLVDAATAQVLARRLPTDLALVPGGLADPGTLAALAGAEVGSVVLADAALPTSTPTFFTPSGSVRLPTEDGTLPVLLTDTGLSAALAMPLNSAEQVTDARQRLLADTLTTVAELPETQRLLVMAPEPGWRPSALGAGMVVDTVAGTPWLRPTSLAAALAREPSTMDRTLAPYGPEQRAQELPAAQVAAVRRQYAGLRDYRAVVSDPEDVGVTARTAPSRGLAAWQRQHPEQRAALRARISGQVQEAISSVRTVSSGSITVSGASGTIPVTVENAGPLPVTVGLTMTSSPPQLFTAEPVPAFEVAPGRRTSVEVTAEVIAAGSIPVVVQLTTARGEPFGEATVLTVQSSAYANAARILVQVALGALVLAVVVHGVRRARRRRAVARGPEIPQESSADQPGAGPPAADPSHRSEVSRG
ncbi:MAG TPA: DUF6049 family protein [Candidatus Nanopelagicales bacterium]